MIHLLTQSEKKKLISDSSNAFFKVMFYVIKKDSWPIHVVLNRDFLRQKNLL